MAKQQEQERLEKGMQGQKLLDCKHRCNQYVQNIDLERLSEEGKSSLLDLKGTHNAFHCMSALEPLI